MVVKKYFLRLLLGTAILCPVARPICAAEVAFKIETPPTKDEWQHFNKMRPGQLVALWQFQESRGNKTLGTWAWQWRLGWVRQCGQNSLAQICPQILQQGLSDDAMVVRAESAHTLGLLNRGKPNKALVQSLAKSYADPRNNRNGSPLFVCDRILGALRNIGGDYAEETATRLANKHPSTALFWSKMRRQNP